MNPKLRNVALSVVLLFGFVAATRADSSSPALGPVPAPQVSAPSLSLSPVTFPGEVWARYSRSFDGVGQDQYDIIQAAKLRAFPLLQPYVGATRYELSGNINQTYLKYGVRTQVFHPFTVGIEEEHYVSGNNVPNAVVGYVSLYKNWELLK